MPEGDNDERPWECLTQRWQAQNIVVVLGKIAPLPRFARNEDRRDVAPEPCQRVASRSAGHEAVAADVFPACKYAPEHFLQRFRAVGIHHEAIAMGAQAFLLTLLPAGRKALPPVGCQHRSEEHTSELQSLMRISYAVFC